MARPSAAPRGADEPKAQPAELVLLHGIPFGSAADDHGRRLSGNTHIGYLPGRHMREAVDVALAVQSCVGRLRLQERITDEIARTLYALLRPDGLGVVVEANHRAAGGIEFIATMTTIRLLGALRDWPGIGRTIAHRGGIRGRIATIRRATELAHQDKAMVAP